MPFDVGSSINHYSITARLGEGGMGTVYSANDTQLGRSVAIKVLRPALADDPERLERFEREARTVASLNHPNVVTLYSVEKTDEIRFITMELVDGVPLSDIIGDNGVSIDEFFRLALPLVEAIASAHARGITHRDLKPSNIMIDRERRVKVLDFGLAKLTEGHPLISGHETHSPTAALTGAGQIVGTVAYMAPEQAEGKPVDPRSDIFSLGVLFYEMITGRQPFVGDSPVSVLSSILRLEPEPLATVRQEVPRQLQRILDHCLAKDPHRRYQSVLDLRNALDALRDELRTDALRSDERHSGELHLDAWPMEDSLGSGIRRKLTGSGGYAKLLRGLALVAIGALVGGAVVRQVSSVDAPAQPGPVGAELRWELVPLMQSQDQMPAAPAFSSDPAEPPYVVYAADHNGERDLWRAPLPAGQATQLTVDTPVSETDAAFSPDGMYIAYTVDAGDEPGIYLRPTAGQGKRIIPGGAQPSWSPSGEEIAYAKESAIWAASMPNFDAPRRLTNHLSGPLDPAWSPDGEAIFVWSEAHLDVVRCCATRTPRWNRRTKPRRRGRPSPGR